MESSTRKMEKEGTMGEKFHLRQLLERGAQQKNLIWKV